MNIIIYSLAFLALMASYNPYSGSVSAYDQRPTDATLQWRLDNGWVTQEQVDWAETYIAVENCARVGETGTMYLNTPDDLYHLKYLVFDCSGSPETSAWMAMHNIAVEIDYYTRQRTGVGDHHGGWAEVYPNVRGRIHTYSD